MAKGTGGMITGHPPLPDWLRVSRETLESLYSLVGLIRQWNRHINLISKNTEPDIWSRHIFDSAQLFSLANLKKGQWLDIGSGGGFPGLVIAVLANADCPDLRVSLVESDSRKAVFLREAGRILGITCPVHTSRIERIENLSADIISARAVAPLDTLLGYAARHLKQGGVMMFPKGADALQEVHRAQKSWTFDVELIPSKTDDASTILILKRPQHV